MKEIVPGSVKLAEEPGKEFCCKSAPQFDADRLHCFPRLYSLNHPFASTGQGRLRHRTKC